VQQTHENKKYERKILEISEVRNMIGSNTSFTIVVKNYFYFDLSTIVEPVSKCQ